MNAELNKMKHERDQLKADWKLAYREFTSSNTTENKLNVANLAAEHDALDKRIKILEGVGVPPESQRDIWTVGV